jgi:hypothetical protein
VPFDADRRRLDLAVDGAVLLDHHRVGGYPALDLPLNLQKAGRRDVPHDPRPRDEV